MTLQQYQMNLFEESELSILSVEDFRAKLLALQETDEVLKILEELCFLRLHGSHLFSDLSIYSLKMLSDSSLMRGGYIRYDPWSNGRIGVQRGMASV